MLIRGEIRGDVEPPGEARECPRVDVGVVIVLIGV